MRNKFTLAIASLLFVLLSFSFLIAQKAESVDDVSNDLAPISGNHFYVMHAIRSIHSAQFTYAQTYGAGNFGSLQSLAQVGLIDAELGAGAKNGYRFAMTYRIVSTIRQAGFDLHVTPMVRRPRAFSYYQNEGCDIYGAEKNGRNASELDPVIDPCGISLRSDNERAVIESMRHLHRAQITYQATYGAGQFATMEQLFSTGLYNIEFARMSRWRGYNSYLSVTLGNGTTPASYLFRATPSEYGRTGVRSFHIDQTGVLRGADKNGLGASLQDSAIDDCTNGSIFGNEQCAIQNLRIILTAQMTYAATVGGGNYGLHAQLFAAGLIGPNLASGADRGYMSVIGQTPATSNTPASFYAIMTPQTYGITGVRSFYIDQTGILRGADKNGAFATVNDPPINQ